MIHSPPRATSSARLQRILHTLLRTLGAAAVAYGLGAWWYREAPLHTPPEYIVLTPIHGQVAFRRADGALARALNGPTLIQNAQITTRADGTLAFTIRTPQGQDAEVPATQAHACAILDAQGLSLLDASARAQGVHDLTYAASWWEDEVALTLTRELGDLSPLTLRYGCRDGIPYAK